MFGRLHWSFVLYRGDLRENNLEVAEEPIIYYLSETRVDYFYCVHLRHAISVGSVLANSIENEAMHRLYSFLSKELLASSPSEPN